MGWSRCASAEGWEPQGFWSVRRRSFRARANTGAGFPPYPRCHPEGRHYHTLEGFVFDGAAAQREFGFDGLDCQSRLQKFSKTFFLASSQPLSELWQRESEQHHSERDDDGGQISSRNALGERGG